MRTANKRPKMKFVESAFNDIISTIGCSQAESGGLLFGREDDFIVRKFVFDQHAKVTRSTYTVTPEFLNPVIKRLWNDEGLSVIGFIHSHPHGYGRLSSPDIEYFSNMFVSMPRKQYLTPVVFTAPDGGFKINAHILPNGSKETILADLEILPDDFQHIEESEDKLKKVKQGQPVLEASLSFTGKFDSFVSILWDVWRLAMAYSLGWFLLKSIHLLIIQLTKSGLL